MSAPSLEPHSVRGGTEGTQSSSALTTTTFAEELRALVSSAVHLLDAGAEVSVIPIQQTSAPAFLLQIRAPAWSLIPLTGADGARWRLLRGLVREIGDHHGVSIELGLAEPPGSTALPGVRSPALRLPVTIARRDGNP